MSSSNGDEAGQVITASHLSQGLSRVLSHNSSQTCQPQIQALVAALEKFVNQEAHHMQLLIQQEKQKRLDLEQQLHETVKTLNKVKKDIMESERRYPVVMEKLKTLLAQGRNEKTQLNTRLANCMNELQRIKTTMQVNESLEQQLSARREHCYNVDHINQNHEKLPLQRLMSADQATLHRELALCRAIQHQQAHNVKCLREILGMHDESEFEETTGEVTQALKVLQSKVAAFENPKYSKQNFENPVYQKDPNNNEPMSHGQGKADMIEHLSSTLGSIQAMFAGPLRLNLDAPAPEHRQVYRRMQQTLLQSEQDSISELSRRMNGHIQSVTNMLQQMPTPQRSASDVIGRGDVSDDGQSEADFRL